jgi:hypothetical protein
VELKQGIGRGIGGESAQSRERDPGCFGDTAPNTCEVLRSDAYDREYMAVDRNRAAHNRGIGVKAIAPQRIGENDLVICTISAVIAVGSQEAAALRPEAEELKVIRGDQPGGDRLRVRTRLGEIDLRLGEGKGILPGAPDSRINR